MLTSFYAGYCDAAIDEECARFAIFLRDAILTGMSLKMHADLARVFTIYIVIII